VVKRFRELDGLRGIACLAVVASHYTGGFDGLSPDSPKAFFDFSIGAFGVQLFFLISGFVILMTAQRSSRPSDFAISRISRLYPAYWIALSVSIVLAGFFSFPERITSPLKIAANFTMIQRWFLVPNVDSVYWTLAIEMQFYVVVMILLLIFKGKLTDEIVEKFSLMWLVLALVVAVVVSPWSFGLNPQVVALPAQLIINLTLSEFGPLFAIGMLAYISRKNSRVNPLLWVAVPIAIVCAGLLHDWWYALIVAVICAAFLIVVSRKATRVLLFKPVQFFGKISYSLYIFHRIPGFIVIAFVLPVIGRNWAMLAAFIVTTLLAWGLHQVGEVRGTRALKALMLRLRGTKPPLESSDN
jgi:peptidoglycan/LPS O-acetylase OafA/YrhL